jgi:oxygen-dependent protoporphyrinogen oxidase
MMLMAPTMIRPFLRSRLISWPGKMRMGLELLIPPSRKTEDESLARFVRRRLGSELLDKIAAPLMAGIYAADPEALSLQSTFPMFPELEQKYGGLLRGMLKQKQQQKYLHTTQGQQPKRSSMFMTLRGGLQQLVDALLTQLHPESVLLNLRVTSVSREAHQYKVNLFDGTTILADDVVLTTPAYATADMVQGMDPALASKLRAIRYVSTATVSLGFKRFDIPHPLDGYGFVVPFSERRKITACTWASQKFDHRAPDDCVLIRVFVGGARAEGLAELDEDALVQLARQELRITMGINADPLLAKAYCWRKSTPQYEVGHQARVAEIERAVAWHPGLHLAGAGYHGAGIPDCIQSGAQIVQAITTSYMRHESFDFDPSKSPSVCTQ